MNSLAVALGLIFAPMPGMSIGEAFAALGPHAVFGPGCSDDSVSKTIQAAAQPRQAVSPLLKALGPEQLMVMAEFRGNAISAVHVARPALLDLTADQCVAKLAALHGAAIQSDYNGPLRVFQRSAGRLKGYVAHYRAVYRAQRGECIVMLSIT